MQMFGKIPRLCMVKHAAITDHVLSTNPQIDGYRAQVQHIMGQAKQCSSTLNLQFRKYSNKPQVQMIYINPKNIQQKLQQMQARINTNKYQMLVQCKSDPIDNLASPKKIITDQIQTKNYKSIYGDYLGMYQKGEFMHNPLFAMYQFYDQEEKDWKNALMKMYGNIQNKKKCYIARGNSLNNSPRNGKVVNLQAHARIRNTIMKGIQMKSEKLTQRTQRRQKVEQTQRAEKQIKRERRERGYSQSKNIQQQKFDPSMTINLDKIRKINILSPYPNPNPNSNQNWQASQRIFQQYAIERNMFQKQSSIIKPAQKIVFDHLQSKLYRDRNQKYEFIVQRNHKQFKKQKEQQMKPTNDSHKKPQIRIKIPQSCKRVYNTQNKLLVQNMNNGLSKANVKKLVIQFNKTICDLSPKKQQPRNSTRGYSRTKFIKNSSILHKSNTSKDPSNVCLNLTLQQ